MNEEQSTKNKQCQQAHQKYIPALTDAATGSLLHMIRFPIAKQDTPSQICGIAHRVGHTQVAGNKHIVYRLKLKLSFADRKTATLPGFFILNNGVFVQYINSFSNLANP